MSNYGQQPPYGPNPYGPQNPYGQPQQPYGRPGQPGQPYGPPPNPYGPGPGQQGPPPPVQGQPGPYAPPQPGQNPYGPGYPPPQQWAPQVPTPQPRLTQRALIVVTMDSVPGRVVTGVLGDAVGVVARSRELPRELRTGGQLDAYAIMLTQSRQDAVNRLVEMAKAAGADAVLGLRYDSSEITQSLSEVVAYGTAVTLNEVAEESQPATTTEDDAPGNGDTGAAPPAEPLTPPDFSGPEEPMPAATPQSGSSDPTQPWPPTQWPPQT